MMQESVLRPIINSLIWARKSQDSDAMYDMVQQCVQYLEQLGHTDTELYKELKTGALPSFPFLYQALQNDSSIAIEKSLRFVLEKKPEEIVSSDTEKSTVDSSGTDTPAEVKIEEAIEAENRIEEAAIEPSEEVTLEVKSEVISEEPVQTEEEKEIKKLRSRIRSHRTSSKKSKSKKSKEIEKSAKPRNMNFWGEQVGKQALETLGLLEPESLSVLHKQGIKTIADILLYPPKDFHRYAQATLSPTMPDGQYVIRGVIVSKFLRFSPHMEKWEILLEQSGIQAKIVWNKQPRGWDSWCIGEGFGCIGEVEIEDDIRIFGAEPLGLKGKGAGLVPEYGLIDDLEHRNLIAHILQEYGPSIQDPIPNDIISSVKLLPYREALREAHFPANRDFRGQKRLAFDEVFSYLLCNRLQNTEESCRGYAHQLLHDSIAHLGQVQNITLSDEQEIIFSKIRRELRSSRPMLHLLQGDVGSGKTLLAFFCAILVAKANKTVLYISSSEYDAERRYLSAETMFSEIGIKAKLIVSDLSKAQKDALDRNELQVIFGTEALLKPENQHKVGLVIIEEMDEQSALQKIEHVLPKKKVKPDILFFTPSPLSLSSLEKYFSSMSLSILKTPKISHPRTLICTTEQREEVYAAVQKELEANRQAYIILPRQGKSDLLSLKEALSMAGKVGEAFLPEARIGVYSTEMSRLDRIRVFEDFQHRRIDVLFCTAHIEDVPAVRNVACVVLEFADKSSFMRVHRLRGLLYGSYYDACCYLISSSQTSEEKQKELQQLAHQTNGFSLVEQSKEPEVQYRWLTGESKLRLQARKCAGQINNMEVQRGRWPLLNHHLKGLWPELSSQINFSEQKKSKNKHRRSRKKRS